MRPHKVRSKMKNRKSSPTKLEKEINGGRRSPRLRQRVAWMYYVEDMTQSDIAEALSIGRITVVRLLAEARAMNEVRVTLARDAAIDSSVEIALQKAWGIPEVIVAPISSSDVDPRAPIAAAAGPHISRMLRPGMKLGLGWGETLNRVLGYIEERPTADLSVVSLLGGITRVRTANPTEFAWQFARLFGADCYLLAAPAIVDSVATKKALVERCGLSEVFSFAKSLDAVVLGVGSINSKSTNFYGMISEAELEALRKKGAVGDTLYNFFDARGRLVDHSLNERSMSIPLASVRAAPVRILVAGGSEKLAAMIGAFRLLRPTVLITDEITANELLELAPKT